MKTAEAPTTPVSATTFVLIEAAIKHAERTKTWVASKSGIPLSTFLRKLSGHTDFTVGEVARIARALGVPAYTLLPKEFSRPILATAAA